MVLLDRPGSGFSQAASSQALAAQADLTAKVIALLNLDKPLVVGHSFGGAVGLALALDHPESVGGLALVAPLTHPFAPPEVIAGLGMHNRLARWLGVWTLGPLVALMRIGLTQRMVFAPDLMIPEFWTRAGGFLAMRPSPMLAAGRELRVVQKELTGMAARYAALTVPVAVLFGDGDVVLDPKAQGPAFCAKAPQAELTMVHGGHMLPMTQPKTDQILYSQYSGAARRRLSPQEQIMVLRKILVSAACLAVSAASAAAFELKSPDVADGGTIAEKFIYNSFGCTGGNLSPALSWSDPPAGTEKLRRADARSRRADRRRRLLALDRL